MCERTGESLNTGRKEKTGAEAWMRPQIYRNLLGCEYCEMDKPVFVRRKFCFWVAVWKMEKEHIMITGRNVEYVPGLQQTNKQPLSVRETRPVIRLSWPACSHRARGTNIQPQNTLSDIGLPLRGRMADCRASLGGWKGSIQRFCKDGQVQFKTFWEQQKWKLDLLTPYLKYIKQ